jgi:hypothetical protein
MAKLFLKKILEIEVSMVLSKKLNLNAVLNNGAKRKVIKTTIFKIFAGRSKLCKLKKSDARVHFPHIAN